MPGLAFHLSSKLKSGYPTSINNLLLIGLIINLMSINKSEKNEKITIVKNRTCVPFSVEIKIDTSDISYINNLLLICLIICLIMPINIMSIKSEKKLS